MTGYHATLAGLFFVYIRILSERINKYLSIYQRIYLSGSLYILSVSVRRDYSKQQKEDLGGQQNVERREIV